METTAVLDLGSETLKLGYAANVPSEEEPRVVLPSCVKVDGESVCWAVHHGQPANWDAVETLLYHAFYNRLGWVIGTEGNLVLVEPVLSAKQDREQLIQLLFETFNCSGLYIQDAAALSLFAVGKQAGITADIGHGKVEVAAVIDGVTSAATATQLDFTGQDLTTYLQQLLAGDPNHPQHPSTAQAQALKCLCSKAAPTAAAYQQLATSQHPNSSSSSSSEPPDAPQSFTLPDGFSFQVSPAQAHAVAEVVLRPELLGLYCPGLAPAIADAMLTHPDTTTKRQLAENVHIVGGGGNIPGLGERVLHEVKELTNGNITPALAAIPEYMPRSTRQYAAWQGGAVVAKVVQGQGQFVLKEEYDELGPAGVYRRCA